MTGRRDYDRLLEGKFEMIEKLFTEKFDRLHDLQERTLAQTTKTNGRVTKLENETEVVRFIGKRKWAIGLVFIILYAITIQEFRDLIRDIMI